MTLYFITCNKGKFEEAKRIIPQIEQLEIDLPEIQEVDPKKIIEEKLKEAGGMYAGEFIVEDTSLYFDCLNGLPGPLIKWFLQTIQNKGLYDIAKRFDNFNAKAITYLGYSNGKEITFFEGIVEGKICEPFGAGFGWDPIFMPSGLKERFSDITKEEKNKISMRGIAFRKLKDYLNKKYKVENK